ncbi:MAG: Iron-sulfur cluster-binding protein [Acetothermia bacterium 64_32]|nr:MAG: Iron-sulfur cluster-binding protein [Acetothermia bacterium 64_32]HAF70344.1 4Fe-4S ferredoxin [Candidatus Acetothermia bacterium]
MSLPRIRLLRRGTQSLGILVGILGFAGIGMTHLIFPGLHCYSCPWAVTVCPIGLMQNLVINGTVPFYWLGFVALYGLVLGRGFCGWFCPFGALNDLLSFRKVRFLKAFSSLKFLVLMGTVVAAWRLSDTWFCKLCPAGGLEASLPYFGLGVAELNTPFLVHMGTLGATLLGMALVSRFWCRYLCPMGALLSLFNRVSLFGLRLEGDRCSGCQLCTRACPMGIEPHLSINSTDCIKCGECVPACRAGALRIGFSLPGKEGRVPVPRSGAFARLNRVLARK